MLGEEGLEILEVLAEDVGGNTLVLFAVFEIRESPRRS